MNEKGKLSKSCPTNGSFLIQANVTCTPSTPAPARKRRRPNQDLQERLARCEELLKEYATAKPESPPAAKSPSPKLADRIPELEDPIPKWKPAGKLIEEDGGVRFMDSYLLTTVYDEVRTNAWLSPKPSWCSNATLRIDMDLHLAQINAQNCGRGDRMRRTHSYAYR